MTNNIYPPDHLLRKWESLIIDEEQNVDVVLYEAFQAGADQELEACCEWFLLEGWHPDHPNKLRAARRPKPPSLKEQAKFAAAVLRSPDETCSIAELQQHWHTICNALESLPD
jgi:hypothetical protein